MWRSRPRGLEGLDSWGSGSPVHPDLSENTASASRAEAGAGGGGVINGASGKPQGTSLACWLPSKESVPELLNTPACGARRPTTRAGNKAPALASTGPMSTGQAGLRWPDPRSLLVDRTKTPRHPRSSRGIVRTPAEVRAFPASPRSGGCCISWIILKSMRAIGLSSASLSFEVLDEPVS